MMTTEAFKSTAAAIFIGAFGLFLIWRGVVGTDGLLPRWMVILSGAVTLILPFAYLVLKLLPWLFPSAS